MPENLAYKTIDNKLPESLLKRDQQALSELYDKYSRALFMVIKSNVKDTKLAEDILQQAFVRIFETIDQFDPSKQRFLVWMLQLTRSLLLETTAFTPNKIQESSNNVRLVKERTLEKIFLKGYTLERAAEEMNISIEILRTQLRTELNPYRNTDIK